MATITRPMGDIVFTTDNTTAGNWTPITTTTGLGWSYQTYLTSVESTLMVINHHIQEARDHLPEIDDWDEARTEEQRAFDILRGLDREDAYINHVTDLVIEHLQKSVKR